MRTSDFAPPELIPTKREIDMMNRGRAASDALHLIVERGFEITLCDPIGQRYQDWFAARRTWFTDPLDWQMMLAIQIHAPRPVGYGETDEITTQLTQYAYEHFWARKRAAVESWYVRRALVDPAYGTLDLETAITHFTQTLLERSAQYYRLLEEGP